MAMFMCECLCVCFCMYLYSLRVMFVVVGGVWYGFYATFNLAIGFCSVSVVGHVFCSPCPIFSVDKCTRRLEPHTQQKKRTAHAFTCERGEVGAN